MEIYSTQPFFTLELEIKPAEQQEEANSGVPWRPYGAGVARVARRLVQLLL